MTHHLFAPPTDVAERRAFDRNLVAVILLTAILSFPYLGQAAFGGTSDLISLLTCALMGLALIWRRSRPTLMLTLVTLGGVLQLLLLRWPVTSVIVIPIAAYSFARWTDGRRSRLVLPLGAAASILGPFSWMGVFFPNQAEITGELITSVVFYSITVLVCAGLVITPYAIGRRIRDAHTVAEERRRSDIQQYESAIAERDAMNRMVEARTRAQIARELHDIVAHSLSVMIVQAEGGKALATKRPEKAAEVLETIADTGRDALVEMRRIVGVLRGSDDQGAEYAPTPGLPDIGEMVHRAGERVTLQVTGPVPEVSPALGLTVYRIAQEGVTNVLKHAGAHAQSQVRLTYLPHLIVVEVEDDGVGSASVSDGRGHGLRGMQERVASMGGRLLTRPKSEGGYLVRALFPMPGHVLPQSPRSHPSPTVPTAATDREPTTGLDARNPQPPAAWGQPADAGPPPSGHRGADEPTLSMPTEPQPEPAGRSTRTHLWRTP